MKTKLNTRSPGFAIVCDARKGFSLGVHTLGLVDRKIEKHLWWTSDEPDLLMHFPTRGEARQALKRLRHNNPRIIPHDRACQVIHSQGALINHHMAEALNSHVVA